MNEQIFDATLADMVKHNLADNPILAKHVATARRYFLKFAAANGWDEQEMHKRARQFVDTACHAADDEVFNRNQDGHQCSPELLD